MNDIDKLLEYVRKTNPEMDGQKLIEKLCENRKNKSFNRLSNPLC